MKKKIKSKKNRDQSQSACLKRLSSIRQGLFFSFLMVFLIGANGSQAYAGQDSSLMVILVNMVPLVALLGLTYFMVIRPQSMERKKHQDMLEQLKKGDEVELTSGLFGKVFELGSEAEKTLTLEVANGVRLKFRKSAIIAVVKT